MGRESAFKRNKNPVYITCYLLAGFLLSGCQALAPFTRTSEDMVQRNYLISVQELIQRKDFQAAARENSRILEAYSRQSKMGKPDQNDPVQTNYTLNAQLLSILLNQVIDSQEQLENLHIEILKNREQATAQIRAVQRLKKRLKSLEKELDDMEILTERIKTLEAEKSNLLEQINRLKAIDLNPA